MNRRLRVGRGKIVLASFLVMLVGCHEELGPQTSSLGIVEGHVRIGDDPVTQGWVEFLPVDGTVGPLRSGCLNADGSFRVAGVPLGKVAIRVVGLPRVETADPVLATYLLRIRQIFLIRRHILSGETTVEIDLRNEARRH